MTAPMIEKAVREAFKYAKKAGPMIYQWPDGSPTEVVKQFFRGSYGGMVIELWFNYTTNIIETAWPK